MATVIIQKRKGEKRTTYQIHYKDPRSGQKKYYKTCFKYKEAQQAAQSLRMLIDNGKLTEVKKNKRKVGLMTFAEVAECLVQDWQKRHIRKELSKDTFTGYETRVKVLNRSFGKMLLCEIGKKDLLDYQEKLFEDFSAVTSNRNLFVIKQIFKHGLKLGAVVDDPAAGIRYLSEKEHERNLFLMPDGIQKIIRASQKTRAKFYMPALIYLGAEHGASKQEALSLEWSDIDFGFNGQGLIKLFRTKNSRKRTEYLMPKTKESLESWRKHLEWMRHRRKVKVEDARFVFCRLSGEPIKRFDGAWRRICRIAGVEGFHYHDLRHTFCSNLLLSGSDLKDVKEMIGHSDLAMTDRYSHLTANRKLSRQQKLAEHYYGETGIEKSEMG